MQKEVTPPKKVKYRYAGNESLTEIIKKSTPKELIPTKKTGYAFGIIFLIVVIIALLKFPLGAMMAGNANVSITVGIPKTFLEFNLMNPEEPPVKIGGLIIDLLLYLFLAYAIDVILNLVMNNRLIESLEKKKKRPKIFKDKKETKTIAEKITEKVIGKPPQSNAGNPS